MPDEEKGPEGFAKFMQDFFARDSTLDEVSDSTKDRANRLWGELQVLEEQLKARTEFDDVAFDEQRGSFYRSRFNHPANVFAREQQEARESDRVGPDPEGEDRIRRFDQDVAFFLDETKKMEDRRSEILGEMQGERLKSIFSDLLSVPVGTILAPVRGAVGTAQAAGRGIKAGAGVVKEGAKSGKENLKKDVQQIREVTGAGVEKAGDIFSQLRGISAQTHADPDADRGAFMDAIFALDEQGFAPMLIGLAEVLKGMTAEGSKASPRAREAERVAGR